MEKDEYEIAIGRAENITASGIDFDRIFTNMNRN